MRSRYDLVDAALEAAELDRNRAGGLLAGGIAFRAFVWLLPMALVSGASSDSCATSRWTIPTMSRLQVGLAGVIAERGGIGQLAVALRALRPS